MAVLLILTMVAGCGANQSNENSSVKSPNSKTESIKIGMLAPITGNAAAPGADMRDGLRLLLKEKGNTLGGRPIELIIEDSASDASTAVTKAKKLVENDGVSLIVGPLMATEAYAVAPYLKDKKVINILGVPSGDDLTQRLKSDYILRTGWTSSQPMYALADYAYKNLRYKKIAVIAQDYAFGYESVGGFQYQFEQLGGQIVKKIWTPIGTTDFGPYLAQIPRDVDAVLAIEAGGDAVNFIPEYGNYGIKLPLIGTGASTDESILPKLGDTAVGFVTALHYSASLTTPENQKFVSDFTKEFGRGSSYYAESGYTAGLFIEQVLKDLGDQYKDTAKFSQAFKNVKIIAPRGPVSIDSYNNPVENIYIRKVEKVNGKLQNTVISTIPNISQFWTYGPDTVLAHPPFSKDFPK